MKPLMLVSPAQAEALYDAHLEVREDPRLEDRFARLPWIDDDSAEDAAAPSHAPPGHFGERRPIQRKVA